MSSASGGRCAAARVPLRGVQSITLSKNARTNDYMRQKSAFKISNKILTSEHLNLTSKSGVRCLIIASMIERVIRTFTATPDVRRPCNYVFISLTTSGCFAKIPYWPEPANACCHSMYFFVAADHPRFVSLSIHFDIVPLRMVLYSFGNRRLRCFSISVGDQWVLCAASSIAGHRNGWYQLVRLLRLCFAPPCWPLCVSFHADPLREISARSSSSDGLLVSSYSTCWLIRKLNVSFFCPTHFVNVFLVLLRLRILCFL